MPCPFEKYSKRYDDWFENNHYAYESEIMAVGRLLPEGGNGIEIGVGSGRFAARFGIRHGLEPSGKMGKLATSRGIDVTVGVAEKTPFPDNSFDFALLVTTICFLDDTKKAFGEVHRILKDSGSVIVGFVDKDSPLGRQYLKNKNKSDFYREATFFSYEEVVQALVKAGFRDFECVQTIFRPLTEIRTIEPVKDGHGEGSFLVVRGTKRGGL
ncbi:MAG: class I SAM-dependent methyltransferase [Spirochaetaceae bacterium]|nr:MAG: class I SAM-dependent methyltransferase [Spirochaetaceae bacterium]